MEDTGGVLTAVARSGPNSAGSSGANRSSSPQRSPPHRTKPEDSTTLTERPHYPMAASSRLGGLLAGRFDR